MNRGRFQLRKFDPFQMPGDLVRRLAVGRDTALRTLLDVVGENLAVAGAPPQHVCLIAPRGTGKTFLLRLLGLELADRLAAGEKVVFLHLPEEMPHVLSPVSFLREIRKRLRGEGPAANAPRKHDDGSAWKGLVEDIDSDLAARFGAGEGLLVLCVENIKDVLRDAFPETSQQRNLRAWLERPGGRIMLAAASSTGPFDKDADKALFAIGRSIDLIPWTTAETMDFLDRVMQARDGRGLSTSDERIARAITTFTGGSPRMAVALAEVLGAEDALSAAQTLDGLIDNLQEYYLDRLKDMGREAKRCIGNMLTEGENVSQTEVARRLGMMQSEVAQVFRKLENDSFLVGDRLANHKEKFYRVADRVFVHFYNVRILYHGTERSVLAPILDFLVSAFTESQRVEQAERLMARGLRNDAQVLLDTLPVLNEVTIDYKWWTGMRGSVDFAADVVAERAPDRIDIINLIRELVKDRHRAGSIVAAYAHLEPDGPWPELNWFVGGLGYLAGGQPAQARHWLEKFINAAGPPWLTCLTYVMQCSNEATAGNLDGVSRCADELESIPLDIGGNEFSSCALNFRRYLAAIRGDFDSAERYSKRVSELVHTPGWDWLAVSGFRRLAVYTGRRGDRQQAMHFARQALEVAERAQRPLSIAVSKQSLADCLLEEGKPADALPLAEQAAAISLDTNEFHDYLDAVVTVCAALMALHRPQDAIDTMRDATNVVDRQDGLYLRGRAYATLAWYLSSPHVNSAGTLKSDAGDFADRALAILDDIPAFAWFRSLALGARLALAGARNDDIARVQVGHQVAGVARQAGRTEFVAWALAEVVAGRFNQKQYQDCIDEATEALVELLQSAGDVIWDTNFIATKLAQALRAERRESDMKTLVAGILHRTDATATAAGRAAVARAFIGAAVDIGDYDWGVKLATDLLLHRNNTVAQGTPDRMDQVLACIAAANAWDRMAPYLDAAIWDTAASQPAGNAIAGVLKRTEGANGRPAAYAIFRGFWTVVRAAPDDGQPQFEILRQLLTSRQINHLSAGLLTDIADTLAAEAPGRFDAEQDMLRDFARFNASGRDPAMLARLNPDVATALRAADPELQAPPLAEPAGARTAAKARRKPNTARRKSR